MSNLDALRRTVSSTLVVAARKWRRTSHGVLAAFNVSEACATPLLTASRLGSAVRQVTLADHIGIEGPSLVRLLDQLCAAGLMRRDEDPEDRRAKTVVLTDEGRAVTAKMEEELVTLRAQALKGVSRDDLEAALRVLDAFTTDAAGRAEPGSVERDTRHERAQPVRPESVRHEATKHTSSAKREPAKSEVAASKVKPTSGKSAAKMPGKSRGTAKARKSTKRGARATAPHNADSE
ncbi:MarR family transcriptional regulator for hemolysin [Paraburkholderia sp. WSM4179]|uniref:MarR family winged helix-turn-helix transcriptional regulator n=1 Tax=Paraburkholderia sp. WSM4179 TaxID=2991073 RepID=UPI0003795422|nr:MULTISPECIES: MarR family transcriptional regulator [Paraburkholderia]MDH6151425.1 MarR family transcriptional regulator for hemolysin [Paraburkholderia sp. WSM4179]